MKTTKFTDKQALAFALHREYGKLWEARRGLGYHKLKTPIQKGWKRQFRVREKILKTSEGVRFKTILRYVQNSDYSRTTVFPPDKVLKLKAITDHVMKKTEWPDWYIKKYFRAFSDPSRAYKTGVELKYPTSYEVKREDVFEIEIVPNFILEIPIIDPAIESRIKEIDNKMWSHNLWPVIDRIVRGSHGSGDKDWNRMKDPLLEEFEKEIREGLSEQF